MQLWSGGGSAVSTVGTSTHCKQPHLLSGMALMLLEQGTLNMHMPSKLPLGDCLGGWEESWICLLWHTRLT